MSEAALGTDLDGDTGPGVTAALTSSDNLNWNCFLTHLELLLLFKPKPDTEGPSWGEGLTCAQSSTVLPGSGCGMLGWPLVLEGPRGSLSVHSCVCERNPKHWGSPSLSSLAMCSLVWSGHLITHLACTELDVTSHAENTLSFCVVSCAGLWASPC